MRDKDPIQKGFKRNLNVSMTPAEGGGLLCRPLKSNISHLCTLTAALSHVTHLPRPHNCTSMKIPRCTPLLSFRALMGLLKVVDVVDFLNSTVALCHIPASACAARFRDFVLIILHSEWNLPSQIQNLACNCGIEMRHSFVLDWHVVNPSHAQIYLGHSSCWTVTLLWCHSYVVSTILCKKDIFLFRHADVVVLFLNMEANYADIFLICWNVRARVCVCVCHRKQP